MQTKICIGLHFKETIEAHLNIGQASKNLSNNYNKLIKTKTKQHRL